MKKVLLLIVLSVSLVSGYSQNIHDSAFADNETDSLPSHKPNHKVIKTAAIAAGYAGSVFLCYRYFDEDIQEFSQSYQNKALSSFAKTYEYAGLGKSNFILAAGVAVTSLITKDKKLQKTAILLAGGHILNDFVTNQIKVSFQRHRPNTGDPYHTFDWREGVKLNTSFISAHTSNAFATATAFATVYGDKKWVPVVAYSAASLVGLCRIYNNAHWASDVMGGAAIGFLSVKAVNALYTVAERKFSFLPQVSNGHYTATLVFNL